MDTEKEDAYHVESLDFAKIVADGKIAADEEVALGVIASIRKYPKAVMWSVLVSMTIVMEGYDIVLVGNLFSQPAFRERYGKYYGPDLGYQISGPWQVGLGNASTCGTIFGAFANGYLTVRFGYRKTLLVSLFALTCFIFVPFFATKIEHLLAASILCGLPFGVFATMGPAYASEVGPVALRGPLAVFVNFCWGAGQLISAGVLQGCEPLTTEWAYRIPFAVQWVWPIPLGLILWFAPESPWWLVEKGQYDKAEASVKRLSAKDKQDDAWQTVAMMIHTNKTEKAQTESTSYIECFKGSDRRRTFIVMFVYAAQTLCGLAIGGNPTYFLLQAGLDPTDGYKAGVGGFACSCVGTITAWFVMNRFGRRPILVFGLFALSAILLIIGIVSASAHSVGASWAQGGLTFLWMYTFATTVASITYAIIAELSAVRLRSKSVCLARIGYYVASIIIGVIMPYMINPTEGNWKGKVGFFWGGVALVLAVISFFYVPEGKGRTYEELDVMFKNKVPARKFSEYQVDVYGEEIPIAAPEEKTE
ncbi:general substrate transporter [Lipomyces arxii]|uniref:general substrate transporter n=1 Tax=Lipomyces arxii TaxID=56418 RepID=UPI0034CE0227